MARRTSRRTYTRRRRAARRHTLSEKRAYWVGYGHGLSYPSSKSKSYKDSLTAREEESYMAGFKKADAIVIK